MATKEMKRGLEKNRILIEKLNALSNLYVEKQKETNTNKFTLGILQEASSLPLKVWKCHQITWRKFPSHHKTNAIQATLNIS